MNTKLFFTGLMMAGFFLVSGITEVRACDIELEIIDNIQSKYRPGDELVVKVTVHFTHRNCPEGIESTKFTSDGLKIIGATKWTEVASGVFERKLKVRIDESMNGSAVLNAVRKCDKDGGRGTIRLAGNQ
jgi:hypothetical protein